MTTTKQAPTKPDTAPPSRIAAMGYAAGSATSPFAPFRFERREPGPRDVQIDILYCGVCHSDLHTARNEWARHRLSRACPGHEIVGRVTQGRRATSRSSRSGDLAGVGCMVDSCRTCASCRRGPRAVLRHTARSFTYNSPDTHMPAAVDLRRLLRPRSSSTSTSCCASPTKLDPAGGRAAAVRRASPPTRRCGTGRSGPGKKVGIVGLGGLGPHGREVRARVRRARRCCSPPRRARSRTRKRLGADEVVVSKDADEMAKHARQLRLHPRTPSRRRTTSTPFIALLKRDGTLVPGRRARAAAPVAERVQPDLRPPRARRLADRRHRRRRRRCSTSAPSTASSSDIEMIPIQKINEAYERMLKSDVKYRFVIDMASLAEDGKQSG